MYCRFCGKKIEDDSRFCKYCGRKLESSSNCSYSSDSNHSYSSSSSSNERNGIYRGTDGKQYTVIDGIMYNEDGWDVGRVPGWWSGDY